MPMHDVGYRKWKGALTSKVARWWMIAESGIDIAFRSQWIKRMLLAAWIPIIGMGTLVFIFENTLSDRDSEIERLRREAAAFGIDIDDEEQVLEFLKNFDPNKNRIPFDFEGIDGPQERSFETPDGRKIIISDQSGPPVVKELKKKLAAANPQELSKEDVMFRLAALKMPNNFPEGIPYRDTILKAYTSPDSGVARKVGWSYFLTVFLSYPQGIATVILLALIVPPLISRDLRSRAYFIYFAKPIGRLEYLLGKFTIPAVFLFFITTLPAMGLFIFAVMLSPDFSVLSDTWHLPLRIVMASAIMIIPTVSLALMLSSLTEESRFATFSLFAIWVMTAGAYFVMTVFNTISQVIEADQNNQNIQFDDLVPLHSNWQLISLYHSIMNVQSWVFGITPLDFSVIGGLILLAVITVLSWVVLYWRVSAPIRI